jgi:hypothetical protein
MRLRAHVLAGVLLLLAGCDLDPIDEGTILVTISTSEFVVSPDTPATITVTARNASQDRVMWGRGSSSCQLSLAVLTPAGQRYAADVRACTEDLIEQALAPGATRTEVFEWGGEAYEGGETIFLTSDSYRLIANAGEKGESQSLELQLIRP